MYIKISFQDNRDWTTITGRVIKWDNPSSKIKPERVVPSYIAPEITTDTWNGIEYDVQHVTWDSYRFEFFAKEAEVFDLVKMKSCDNITITQYETIDNTNKTKVYEVDTRKGDYFEIDDPEQIDNTTSFRTGISFRTQRNLINKADPILNTNNIDLGSTGTTNLEVKASTDISLSNGSISEIDTVSPYQYDRNPTVIYSNNTLSYYYQLSSGSGFSKRGNSLNISGFGNAQLSQCKKKYNGYPTVNILGDGNGKLARFYFDGTNFAQVGNSLEIGSGVDPSIASFDKDDYNDSVLIATTQTNVSFVTYTFDGVDWSLDATIPTYNPTDTCDNVSISTRGFSGSGDPQFGFVRENQSDTNQLTVSSIIYQGAFGWSESFTEIKVTGSGKNSHTFSGTYSYVADEGSGFIRYVSISTGNIIETDLTTITNPSVSGSLPIYMSSDDTTIYEYGIGTSPAVYYSDFDVLGFENTSNKVTVEWSDGTEKTIESIIQIGDSFLHYLNNEQTTIFSNQLAAANPAFINGVEVLSHELEITEVGEDYYKIIINGVTSESIKRFTFNQGTDNKIEFDTNIFYSDYDVVDNDTSTQDVLIDWSDGSQRKLQSVDKSGLKFTTFLYSDEINDFISKLKTATTIEINDVEITEVNYSISEIGSGWNQIEVTGVTTQVNTDFDISPLNTNKLELYNGLIVTNTYNSDYEILKTDRNTESIFVDWPDGTRKLAQTNDKPTITFTTWLDNADLSTFITELKAATSVEINDVVVNEYEYSFEDIGFNYNKVVLTGITTTTVTNFDLTPNNTYNLELTVNAVVTNYYTDYPVELTSLPPVLTTYNNTGGIDVRTRSISKNAKKITLFLDETDTFALKEDFELGTAKLDTVVVKENESIVITKIGVDLYRVECDLIMDTTKVY